MQGTSVNQAPLAPGINIDSYYTGNDFCLLVETQFIVTPIFPYCYDSGKNRCPCVSVHMLVINIYNNICLLYLEKRGTVMKMPCKLDTVEVLVYQHLPVFSKD